MNVQEIADLVSQGRIEEAEEAGIAAGFLVRTSHGGLRHNPKIESKFIERKQFEDASYLFVANKEKGIALVQKIEKLIQRLRHQAIPTESESIPLELKDHPTKTWIMVCHEIDEDFPLAENIAFSFAKHIKRFFHVEPVMIIENRIFAWRLYTWE